MRSASHSPKSFNPIDVRRHETEVAGAATCRIAGGQLAITERFAGVAVEPEQSLIAWSSLGIRRTRQASEARGRTRD